jgi:HNH endonuclease/Protein of unknown function (DUF3298)
MASRPAIPSDLKRRILVEAGHRCSIPACGATQIDIHHIEPWEKCKKHEYENLIALCPNCHRRVHNNEIDRKSLSYYKARLASLWIETDEKSNKIVNERHDQDWIIREINEQDLQYSFNCEIPVFLDQKLNELNFTVEAFAISELQKLRGYGLRKESRHNTISIKFRVTDFSPNLVSIKYLIYWNTRGAAHPNVHTKTMNYTRNPIRLIKLDYLFNMGSNYLECVSNISREYLLELFEGRLDPKWIELGTTPEITNFEKFNITEYGVLFTFDTYQIGPHVAGMHKVIIPFQSIRSILNSNLRL